jgi:hypothetical protein
MEDLQKVKNDIIKMREVVKENFHKEKKYTKEKIFHLHKKYFDKKNRLEVKISHVRKCLKIIYKKYLKIRN